MLNVYQLAYNTCRHDSYINRVDVIPNRRLNPEEQFIKKECFHKLLSNDAHFAIDVIFDLPLELRFVKKLTWHKVATYLIKSKGWTHRKTLNVRKEIKEFLREN